ncbi:MAG: aminotransferase class V-fold PLP-dependent enzyme [Desulfobacterales bacterium]
MVNIKQLQKCSQPLEPDSTQREYLLKHVISYADRYLDKISEAPAYISRPDGGRALWDFPIAEEGTDIKQVLALLQQNVDTTGINPTSGRFLGYIPGGGLYHAALGDYLAAVSNRFAGLYFASPGAVRIENIVIRWLADAVGYPDKAAGNLTSGGSLANLSAIVTARDALGIKGQKIGRSVVYVTEHAHHCIDKAFHISGLDACIKRNVRVDANYRMDPEALVKAIVTDKNSGLNPWFIVASAGTTNTGAVDPLRDIGEIASAHQLWFHVDGAYGGLFALCPEGKKVLKGIHTSDSIVLDPHKALFLPYGTGAVLIKERQNLYAAFNAQADYIQNIINDVDELSPADLSPELTKHFRGLRLWLALKLIGAAPFRAALSEKIHLARYFYEKIKEIDGFEVGPYPDLSVVTYRCLPKQGDADAFNRQLVESIQQDGRIFISSTRMDGKLVLRAAVLCFRTHLDDINEMLDVLKHNAGKLETR